MVLLSKSAKVLYFIKRTFSDIISYYLFDLLQTSFIMYEFAHFSVKANMISFCKGHLLLIAVLSC